MRIADACTAEVDRSANIRSKHRPPVVERFSPADLVCVCVLRIKLCYLVQSSPSPAPGIVLAPLLFFFFTLLLKLFTLFLSVSHSPPGLASRP